MIRIVLADDHRLLTQGLKIVLASNPQLAVVGEAANGQEAVEMVEKLRPDVLITDLKMPGFDGIRVTESVRKLAPQTRVIVLSLYTDDAYVRRALKAGALGYVAKDASGEELVQAVHTVIGGNQFLSPQVDVGS